MPDFSPLYTLIGLLPLDCLQARFMQQALLGLLLLTPMAAVLGVEVINFRMAFFSDAIGHSAFAGVALGLILAVNPRLSMPLFGVLVGLAVMAVRRKSNLSADTAIGIVFSAVVAFGLAVVSRASGVARDMQQFLYGDILTISEGEIAFLGLLFLGMLLFQAVGYNRLLAIALNPVMARVHGIRVALWQYLFAGLLALVVMFSVWAVGVLLVTAMLIVPAATARNLARTAGGMFWWALLAGISSGFAGLTLSAQDWLATSSGATIILVSCCWFAASCVWAALRGHRRA
ncbi:MAG: metal ABC transporter permease [Desulfovibrio sp.]|uniref:metal ABC transporter permease n=1 Tax=Desulfovibrio sp. TaxID=885 RepID=UPI0025C2D944|nr:metal ABC transporter permease [Desulfovibrio sp.]MBS6829082.1 metal ABC transporter permease [Desulfovibrio sp.]